MSFPSGVSLGLHCMLASFLLVPAKAPEQLQSPAQPLPRDSLYSLETGHKTGFWFVAVIVV